MTYELRDDVLHLAIPMEMLQSEPALALLLRLDLKDSCLLDLITAQAPLSCDFFIEPKVEDGQQKRKPTEGRTPETRRPRARVGDNAPAARYRNPRDPSIPNLAGAARPVPARASAPRGSERLPDELRHGSTS